MTALTNALDILQQTSRTFYIPIVRLPGELQAAVASGYLCMRAIDEIEDHPQLDNSTKAKLLRQISLQLQQSVNNSSFGAISKSLSGYQNILPEVTLCLDRWASLAPDSIAPRIWDATAAMADRMGYWAEQNWQIQTEEELDRYTFSVAGAVGLLLSDLWAWYDNTQTNRTYAIGFGRGLQAVNILRNHSEDLTRGVNFLPHGWSKDDLQVYARRNLYLADLYTKQLKPGPALDFCQIPLVLAHGTLDAIAMGKEKLSRSDVLDLVKKFQQIKSA